MCSWILRMHTNNFSSTRSVLVSSLSIPLTDYFAIRDYALASRRLQRYSRASWSRSCRVSPTFVFTWTILLLRVVIIPSTCATCRKLSSECQKQVCAFIITNVPLCFPRSSTWAMSFRDEVSNPLKRRWPQSRTHRHPRTSINSNRSWVF